MRGIDTNVLVRLLIRDEPKQAAAADGFVAAGAWISLLVLVETVWVLSSVYELSRDAIANAIERLLYHAEIVVQDADVATAALAHFRKRPGVEFSDCLILEAARKAGHLPVGTFDREFASLGDELVRL
ncbi:MAG TPA: type II toxin-antitoxin system VapC family toxin [Steroidobacteraceae bacterium]|jgi:predicted nucleic-acid-binding protein|nr:type II toxin-antitoxin system VapC family toxin [Steroidobacteraceae bacterium]